MSSTPDPAGNQQGSRGSGGGGRSKSANKRRNKKKNTDADTSPQLPNLQAQTLFTPGTTGGAADEETVNTTKLIEMKQAREAAHKARLEEEQSDAAAAAKAQSEAEAATAAAAEEDVLAQLEEAEIRAQIREQQMRLEEIRRLMQKSQSQQIKILNEKGKEANEASKRHAAAVEATAKA